MKKRYVRTLILDNGKTELEIYEKSGLLSETSIAFAELHGYEMQEIFLAWLEKVDWERRNHVISTIFQRYTLEGIFSLEDLERFVVEEKQRREDERHKPDTPN